MELSKCYYCLQLLLWFYLYSFFMVNHLRQAFDAFGEEDRSAQCSLLGYFGVKGLWPVVVLKLRYSSYRMSVPKLLEKIRRYLRAQSVKSLISENIFNVVLLYPSPIPVHCRCNIKALFIPI